MIQEYINIKNQNSVHLLGDVPILLFEARRPLESKQSPEALKYRKENFEALTKAPFNSALSSLKSTKRKISYKISTPDNLKSIINGIEINRDLLDYSFEEYFNDKVFDDKNIDPNSILVVIPKFDINNITNIDFNEKLNESIELEVIYVPSEKLIEKRNDYVKFIYKEYDLKNENVFTEKFANEIILDKKDYSITFYAIVNGESKKVTKKLYSHNLGYLPYFNLSNKIGKINETEVLLSDFDGAIAWANRFIGKESDNNVIEARFTHIVKWKVPQKCKNNCMYISEKSCYWDTIAETKCNRCAGTGHEPDTSPFNTINLEMAEGLENDIPIPGMGFIEPGVGILTHNSTMLDSYYDNMLKALFINSQNMTNQSGVSKTFDFEDKINFRKDVISFVFTLMESIVICIDELINIGKQSTSKVIYNLNINLLDTGDITNVVKTNKENSVPYSQRVEDMIQFFILKNGDCKKNYFVYNFLADNDDLFAYDNSEIIQYKVLNASDFDRKLIIHNQGLRIINKILKDYVEDDLENNYSKILELFETEIANKTPKPITIGNTIF